MSDIANLLKAEKITTVVTDLDNTLWQGTLAEGEEITLNKEYYGHLCELHQKGITIIAASKNDEKDVYIAFEKLDVDKELFTSVVANWDPKHLNLERILQTTLIRPETVAFLDDNQFERSEVKKRIPAVHCLDAVDWKILQQIPSLIDRKVQSAREISDRKNRYRTLLQSKVHLSLEEDLEFLYSLNREIRIGKIDPDDLDRFARMLIATHRINFNPGKFDDYTTTISYLHNRINQGDELIAISTYESGVSLGFSGALVLHHKDDTSQILDGTYSCGIFGRYFEQRSLIAVIDKLQKQKKKELEVFVKLTSTNERVRKILTKLGFKQKSRDKDVIRYALQIEKYNTKGRYDWVGLSEEKPELSYAGIFSVQQFFEKYVKPLMQKNSKVINLGSAKGEVIGHLDEPMRDEFYDFVRKNKILYTKIDKQYYPKERNIVGDAENLCIRDESQDIVLGIELLEHTEHYWKAINEMIRVCKPGGYIFASTPSFDYPKHEYPIDLWRLGPRSLASLFPKEHFKVLNLETDGSDDNPYRTMILVQKLDSYKVDIKPFIESETNWRTGLTIFR